MSFGTACVLITLIVCASVLIGIGMDYSNQNKIREYEETISRLEKLLETEGEKK